MRLYEKHIAIIDSDPVSIYILKKVLMTAEDILLETFFFKDAKSFYDYLKSNEPPDLCLINMTLDIGVSSYNIAAYLKKNKATTDIPIIFITDVVDEQLITSIYECGGADYIKTPYNNTELLMRIKTQLKLKHIVYELKNSNSELKRLNTRYKYELELARNVQKNIMLNSKIINKYFETDFIYKPHFSIGGDYLDLLKLKDNCTAFLIGDMAGHGPSTSLKTALLKSFIVTNIYHTNSPADFLKKLNHFLIENFKNIELSYLTFFAGFYNHNTKKLTYCSAAQPFPIYYNSKQNTLSELEIYGTPLGLLDTAEFDEKTITVNPDDKLIVYTDGLMDLHLTDKYYLNSEILKKFLLKNDLIKSPLNHLTKELYKFIVLHNFHSTEFNDDITSLLIKFK